MRPEKTERPKTTEETQARLCSAGFLRSMFRRDGTTAQQPVFSFLSASIRVHLRLKTLPFPFVTIRDHSWAKNSPCAVKTF
jgi:hypothetical protein